METSKINTNEKQENAMKKFILLSFTLVFSMSLWAQTIQGESEEVQVTPPKFAGVPITAYPSEKGQSIENYIVAHMQYPKEDLKYRVEGTQVIQFVVNSDGTLSEFEVINSVSPDMDNEIIRVINTTNGKWIPGTNNDGPVDMHKEIAITCKVTNEESPNNQTDFKAIATAKFSKGSMLLYEKDNPKRALKKFNQGINYLPYEPNLLVMRGYAKFALGDEEGAVQDWKTVKDQTGIDNLRSVASTYDDLEGYSKLMAILDR